MRVLAAAAVLAVAAAAGCSGEASTVIEITIRFSKFEPARIEVPRGEPIRFVLRNTDPIDHEWIVGDDDVHARHRTGTEPRHDERPTEVSIDALSTRRTTVTFDDPGMLRFVCHLPGHESYGMVGTITVS